MIQLGAPPLAGFDDPIRMLSDCHRRIESFLESLLSLAREAGEELDSEERERLATALDYFAHAAPRHTEDEDCSLFPRLRAHAGDVEVRAALETLDRLDQDHRIAHEEHAAVDALGRHWLEAGTLCPSERSALMVVLEALTARYRAHIQIEDGEVFPLASQLLTSDERVAVGREMASRRGIRPSRA